LLIGSIFFDFGLLLLLFEPESPALGLSWGF
jgi:hypothetical protein